MGSDNLESFHKWKNFEEILKHYELYVYPRHDTDGGKLKTNPKVKLINAPQMEISSTAIRQAIKDKKDVRYFVPEEAWNYLKEMHFYEK
jgi:nicotinate-nucleotide adenylyltransferase